MSDNMSTEVSVQNTGLSTSTPEVHDSKGPSRHPYLVKCHAYVCEIEPEYVDVSDGAVAVADQDDGGEPAVKGTFKHDLSYKLEKGLIEDAEIYEFDCTPCGKYPFTEHDANMVIEGHVQYLKGKEWIMQKIGASRSLNYSEVFVDLPNLGIKGGTPDIVDVLDMNTLLVGDYKYGFKEVAPWTEQLMSYSSGLVRKYPVLDVWHMIIQPEIRDMPWMASIPMQRIKKHERMMANIITSSRIPNAPMTPHSDCPYCARYPCTAVQAMVRKTDEYVRREGITELDRLPSEKLQALAKMSASLRKLYGASMAEIARRLHAGAEMSHYCLAPGRSSKSWTDEDEARDALQLAIEIWNERQKERNKKLRPIDRKPMLNIGDFYTTKMDSPSKACSKLGSSKAIMEEIGGLILKKEGSLVPKEKNIRINSEEISC